MAQKLKINVKPTFSAPVVWRLAGDDGNTEEVTYTATFRRVNDEEAKQLQAQLAAGTLTDRELLDKVLVGWNGLLDELGTPYAFTPENRRAAQAEWPTFEAGLVFSYFKHQDAAVVKN